MTPFKPDSPEYLYMQILTPYALGYVIKQLSLTEKVQILGRSGNVYEINSSEGINRVTPNDCYCTFVSQCSYHADIYLRFNVIVKQIFTLPNCVQHRGPLHTIDEITESW